MVGMKMMNNGHDGQSLLTWTKQATTERSWRNSESDNSHSDSSDSDNSDSDNSDSDNVNDSDRGIGDDNERTIPRAITCRGQVTTEEVEEEKSSATKISSEESFIFLNELSNSFFCCLDNLSYPSGVNLEKH